MRTHTLGHCVTVILALCAWTALASAQQATQPASAPAAAAGEVEHLQVTIAKVEGPLVQFRTAADQPWQTAVVGMKLNEEAEIRTGPKSAVQFVIPPDQVITIDRLSTVKVLQAVLQDGKLKTDIGMKYGRTRYDIEEAGREHESTISSPSSTLAVRGTKFSLTDTPPFPAQAVSLTGRVEFNTGRKRLAIGKRGQGKTAVNANQSSAAAAALTSAVIDPNIAMARTDSEAALVDNLLSSGATILLDQTSGIKIVRGGVVPTDQQLIPTLPGQLNFVLRWTGNADLNLGVGVEGGAGEFVAPISGFDVSQSGGKTAFDHQGGPNGGIEVVFWKGNDFPSGLYGLGVTHIAGDPAVATIDAFLGGERQPITNFTNGLVPSITTPVDPGGTAAAIAPINTTLPGFSATAAAPTSRTVRRGR